MDSLDVRRDNSCRRMGDSNMLVHNATRNEVIYSLPTIEGQAVPTITDPIHRNVQLGLTFLLTLPKSNNEHRGGFYRGAGSEYIRSTSVSDPIWDAFLGRWIGEHLTILPLFSNNGNLHTATDISYEIAYCLLLDPRIRKEWLDKADDGDSPLVCIHELIELGKTPNDQLLGLLHSFRFPQTQRIYQLRLDNFNKPT